MKLQLNLTNEGIIFLNHFYLTSIWIFVTSNSLVVFLKSGPVCHLRNPRRYVLYEGPQGQVLLRACANITYNKAHDHSCNQLNS